MFPHVTVNILFLFFWMAIDNNLFQISFIISLLSNMRQYFRYIKKILQVNILISQYVKGRYDRLTTVRAHGFDESGLKRPLMDGVDRFLTYRFDDSRRN